MGTEIERKFILSPAGVSLLKPHLSGVGTPDVKLRQGYVPDSSASFTTKIFFNKAAQPTQVVFDCAEQNLPITIGQAVKGKQINLQELIRNGAVKKTDEDYELLVGGIVEARIRIKGGRDSFFTIKINTPDPAKRQEYEHKISQKDAVAFLYGRINPDQIIKERYSVDGCDVDVYPEGQVSAEREFESETEKGAFQPDSIPWLVGAKEVTGNKKYSNRALAKDGFPPLSP